MGWRGRDLEILPEASEVVWIADELVGEVLHEVGVAVGVHALVGGEVDADAAELELDELEGHEEGHDVEEDEVEHLKGWARDEGGILEE